MHDRAEAEHRQRLEQQLASLRQRELELSEFVENAAVALHWVGADGTILWANQAELDLLGYNKEDYVGRHIAEFHADPDTIDEILRRLAARETLQNYEARLRRKDNSIRYVLISSNVLWDNDTFVHTRCFTRDITDWKLAQQASRESHEMFSALVQFSPVAIVTLTTDGNITLWNQAAERLFGWRSEEVLGRPLPFIPLEKREEHRAMRARDLMGEGFRDREIRRMRKDGSHVDVRVSTVPLRNGTGAVTAIMSVYVDVTESKRHEQQLLAQYGIARMLAQADSVGEAGSRVLRILCENLEWRAAILWTVDSETQKLNPVASWRQVSESSRALEEPCNARALGPGEGIPEQVWVSKRRVWHTRAPENAVSVEGSESEWGVPILLADTVVGVMDFFGDKLREPDQEVVDMVSAVAYQLGEFLERQRVQKSLIERERSYRTLTETASDGIVSVDAASKILLANSATGRIFGYLPNELAGSDLVTLMPDFPEQMRKAKSQMLQFKDARENFCQTVQIEGVHKDGREIPLEVSFSATEQDDQHVFIIRDVTERKRFDEKLRQTAKLESLGLLAGGIAHDFNNLLTGILGNTSIARDMLPETHAAAAPLRDAEDASERAAHLTKQLLAYAGKGRFVIRPFDLSDLVREIAALLKSMIPKTVHLRLDLAERLPCVEGDTTQIQQVVMNLVINGAEAIGEGIDGTVLVATRVQDVDQGYIEQTFGNDEISPGRFVTLEIHDTGSGMDDSTIAKIFDPFFTTKFTGRGLGLAAVMGIVRGHRGVLKVYSTPGNGSTFKVLFPASDQEPPETHTAESRFELAGRGTILVVDDEQVIRKVARSILERFGYKVLLAENGQEALEIFEQAGDRIALVILDLTMPVMSGEEALRQIKTMNPSVRVLLSSGYNEMEAIQRFAGKGLAGFIQKPYTSALLASKLKEILGGAPQ